MPYAIECYLDEKSSEIIRNIWTQLELNHINTDKGVKPHVSLMIYEEIPIENFKEKLLEFSKNIKPINILLSSLGLFCINSPVLFLSPVVSHDLLELHSFFNNFFKEYKDHAWQYYLPGKWVPHCTLALDITWDDVKKAMEICKKITLPLQVTLNRIGILEFRPNKQLVEYGFL